MEWSGDSPNIFSNAAIIAGALIMLLSIRYARDILRHRHAYKYARRWRFMFGLMCLFLAVYIADLVLILYETPRISSILADVVFVLCSIFVYLSVRTSLLTIDDLGHYINDLETTVMARQRLEDMLRRNKEKLARQNAALFYLTRRVLEKDSLEQSLQLITEKAAEILEIDRASVWLFDDERTYISCADLLERPQAVHSHGIRLYKKDYPQYFAALEREGVVDAVDAMADERTKEFTASYLQPLGIVSLLDVPVHTEGKLTGILCNEAVGELRKWTVEDQSFAAAVADIIAIAIGTFGRKQITEQLALSESTFRNAFEYSGIGMALVSPEGKWMKVNKEVCEIIGYSAEELLAKTFQDITHPDDLDTDLKFVNETLDGKRDSYKMEKRYFHKNGSIIWVNLTVSLVRDSRNVPLFFISQIEDITERKRIQRSLELALSLTKATIESTADGIFVVDTTGRIRDYNHQFVELLDLPENVIATRDRRAVVTYLKGKTPDPEFYETRVEEIYSQPAMESHDIITFLDGRIFERHSKPQMVADEIIGRVWSFRDVTKQKVAETLIKKMNADLESRVMQRTQLVNKLNEELKFNIENLKVANRDLESFSYSVSHDLRAPLRAINGFVNLLGQKSTEMDAEAKQFLSTISRNAQKMGHLIEDLLSFSRMGKKEMIKTALDMNKLVQEVLSSINIHEWNANTKLTVGNMLPASGDEVLLKQVFFNLIANAVKYSRTKENPEIELGSQAGVKENTYWIKDNGVGFSMEYYDKLFKAFQRMHSSEEFEGTGVGLAIVQRIIARHGGTVWAEAIKDKGASFYFTLPTSAGSPSESPIATNSIPGAQQ